MTTPSRLYIVSSGDAPLAAKTDCWPASLPAMLTRSTSTPGTVLSTAQGSRPCGTCVNSSLVSVVEVPIFLVSTTGVSSVTFTVSAMPASFSPKLRFTLAPVFTITSRVTVAKFDIPTVNLYVPGSRLRNRNSPWPPEVVDRVPPTVSPVSVTVAPGSNAPDSSLTVP
jgi:hypothetical protein